MLNVPFTRFVERGLAGGVPGLNQGTLVWMLAGFDKTIGDYPASQLFDLSETPMIYSLVPEARRTDTRLARSRPTFDYAKRFHRFAFPEMHFIAHFH